MLLQVRLKTKSLPSDTLHVSAKRVLDVMAAVSTAGWLTPSSPSSTIMASSGLTESNQGGAETIHEMFCLINWILANPRIQLGCASPVSNW